MKRLLRALDVIHEKLTLSDWDNVLIMGGDEGVGKSSLGLHIMEYWYKEKLGRKLDPALIHFVSLSLKQFVTALKDLKRFGLIIYDEAGELSSLRMINKFNYAITKAYEVIRGENLFTILIVPDVFYINPFFSTRRARGYIHVYKRGSFAYWGKNKLRNLIEKNKKYKKKSVLRIKPLFRDTFPKYKGGLLEAYKQKKQEKMKDVREELYKKLQVDEERHDLLKYIYNSYKTVGATKTSKIFEMSPRTIYRKRDEFLEWQKKESIVPT